MQASAAINTVIINSVSVEIKGKHRPYSNNFTVLAYPAAPADMKLTATETYVHVKCTEFSQEPGRIYACIYTQAGKLDSCISLN